MSEQNQHYRYKEFDFKGPYNLNFGYNKVGMPDPKNIT